MKLKRNASSGDVASTPVSKTTMHNGDIHIPTCESVSTTNIKIESVSTSSNIKIVSAYSLTSFGSSSVSSMTVNNTPQLASSHMSVTKAQKSAPPPLLKVPSRSTAVSHRLVMVQLKTTSFH